VNVTFHCAASVGIAHLTSRLLADPDQAARPQTGVVIASSFLLGVLSHGVLDGLLHQYPIPFMIDPPLAVALISLWCLLVQPRFRLLFTLTFVGAVLPDVIDLGSGIGKLLLHRRLPTVAEWLGFHLPAGHFFPWHWPEGSGSIFDGTRDFVSLTNHLIVMCFVMAAVWTNRKVFSGVPVPAAKESTGRR